MGQITDWVIGLVLVFGVGLISVMVYVLVVKLPAKEAAERTYCEQRGWKRVELYRATACVASDGTLRLIDKP